MSCCCWTDTTWTLSTSTLVCMNVTTMLNAECDTECLVLLFWFCDDKIAKWWLDEEVWEALERVHLANAIRELKEGLKAPVAEYGENFSNGQVLILVMFVLVLDKWCSYWCRIIDWVGLDLLYFFSASTHMHRTRFVAKIQNHCHGWSVWLIVILIGLVWMRWNMNVDKWLSCWNWADIHHVKNQRQLHQWIVRPMLWFSKPFVPTSVSVHPPIFDTCFMHEYCYALLFIDDWMEFAIHWREWFLDGWVDEQVIVQCWRLLIGLIPSSIPIELWCWIKAKSLSLTHLYIWLVSTICLFVFFFVIDIACEWSITFFIPSHFIVAIMTIITNKINNHQTDTPSSIFADMVKKAGPIAAVQLREVAEGHSNQALQRLTIQ